MAERLLTTGQAARIAGVTAMSVVRWCEGGGLASERTVGGHRRIRLAALQVFLRGRGIPIRPAVPAPASRSRIVLLLRPSTARRLRPRLGPSIEVRQDPYATIVSAIARPPRAVVVEAAAVERPLALVDALLGATGLDDTWIVVVGGDARELVTRPVARFDEGRIADALRAATRLRPVRRPPR